MKTVQKLMASERQRFAGPETTASATAAQLLQQQQNAFDHEPSLWTTTPQVVPAPTTDKEAFNARVKVKRYIEVLGHRLQDVMNRWQAIIDASSKPKRKTKKNSSEPVLVDVHPSDFIRTLDKVRLPVLMNILRDIEMVMGFGFTNGEPLDKFMYYWSMGCSLINRMAKRYQWVDDQHQPLLNPQHPIFEDETFQDCVNFLMIRHNYDERQTPTQLILKNLASAYWPALLPVIAKLWPQQQQQAKDTATSETPAAPPPPPEPAPVTVTPTGDTMAPKNDAERRQQAATILTNEYEAAMKLPPNLSLPPNTVKTEPVSLDRRMKHASTWTREEWMDELSQALLFSAKVKNTKDPEMKAVLSKGQGLLWPGIEKYAPPDLMKAFHAANEKLKKGKIGKTTTAMQALKNEL